jgi:hypothetical protein
VSQTKAELIKGLNINASAPATALQIDASGNVNIDSNTLYVDATNNRVGLGSSNPGALFHIEAAGNTVNQQIFTSDNVLNATASLTFGTTPGTRSKAAVQMVNTNTGNASGALALQTNGGSGLTTRLYINDAGSVGIGTTSPAGALDVGAVSGAVTTGDLTVTTGSTTAKVTIGRLSSTASDNTAFRIRDRIDRDVLTVDVGNFIYSQSGSERARIDSSGRFLVGTSTSATIGDAQYARLQVKGNTFAGSDFGILTLQTTTAASSITSGSNIGYLHFSDTNGGSFATIGCVGDGTAGTNDYPGRLVFSTTADGASSPTERMRITNNGTFYINTTAIPGTTSFGTYFDGSAIGYFSSFRNVNGASAACAIGGTAGYAAVMGDGDLENTNNRYTGISDAKLKQNIEDASPQWDDIKAIQVRKYELIANPDRKHIGCVAQELEQVCPGLVIEREDKDGETYKSVAYSVLYMKAVKALQEAMERIEVLEQRLTDAGIA